MHTLITVLVAAVAACAFARPPAAQSGSEALPPDQRYLKELLLSKSLLPRLLAYEDSAGLLPAIPEHEWLNEEIDRINEMETGDSNNNYDMDFTRWIDSDTDSYVPRMYVRPMNIQQPEALETSFKSVTEYMPSLDRTIFPAPVPPFARPKSKLKRQPDELLNKYSNEQREIFAMTPLDKGYYDHPQYTQKHSSKVDQKKQRGKHIEAISETVLEPPRQIRQNPNLSRTKALITGNLEQLRTGLANKEYRLPVSLLPTNLRWLKLNSADSNTSVQDLGDSGTETPRTIHMLEADPAESIYGIALIAAVGTALTIAVFGFAFGWYTLSKKAKAAADVDYPAYGVTGPTVDPSGDRKLAHSAHMYHYQHQKQQIIAMERNGCEQRAGSVSDPESEEENEEGDYTVYECPGFATTGDMEVKNPLFSDEPTPATPGKCEVVKPQPKD